MTQAETDINIDVTVATAQGVCHTIRSFADNLYALPSEVTTVVDGVHWGITTSPVVYWWLGVAGQTVRFYQYGGGSTVLRYILFQNDDTGRITAYDWKNEVQVVVNDTAGLGNCLSFLTLSQVIVAVYQQSATFIE